MQKYRDEIRLELANILKIFSIQYNAVVNTEYTMSLPPVYNDEEECKEAEQILHDLIGDKLVTILDEIPPHGTDDFSYLQNALSGLFFFLGSANVKSGLKGANHTSKFDIDENCLTYGVKTMSMFLYEMLEKKKNTLFI